jgi:hypothetical protein
MKQTKIFDFFFVIYREKQTGKQIEKPFFDDENGNLDILAIVNVYREA